jgi:hypothetical protein
MLRRAARRNMAGNAPQTQHIFRLDVMVSTTDLALEPEALLDHALALARPRMVGQVSQLISEAREKNGLTAKATAGTTKAK